MKFIANLMKSRQFLLYIPCMICA
uniref:Uncharacterized protein n=1 Tax=Arundo donax TaxID=35708 RepID=A0A0A9BWJ6_ARUDO